jgi:hypothetical protein
MTMAERKPLFINATEGFSEEMATTDTITLGGLTMGGNIDLVGNKIVNSAAPTASGDLATKDYVDSVAQSLAIKGPCLVLADSNVAITGLFAIDGVTPVDGDRVLLTGQTDQKQNGPWVVHTGAWVRPNDFLAAAHAAHAFLFVEEGTNYADTGWVCTTNPPGDVVGTNNLTFVQFSAAGQTTAGAGLQKIGLEISAVKGDGIELTSNSGAINVDIASNSGLQLSGTSPNKKVDLLLPSAGGLQKDSSGLSLKLNGSTLQTSSSGVSVKGLPALFEINGSGVSVNVTTDNLDTLTAGPSSVADALHSHTVAAAPKAGRVEDDLAVSEAVSAGDPVYFSTTNDRVGKGDTIDSKAKIVGVARLGQSTTGNTTPVVFSGSCPSVLSSATAGTPYYLATGGGVTTVLPGGGKRVIQVGVAKNATDLFVRVMDFGKKAS